jgi:tetratricopeptide (TPR) repeat protein
LLLQGRNANELGDFLEAQKLCKQAIKEDPHFAHAYFMLAYSSNSTQEFKENLEMAEQHAHHCSEPEQLLIKIGLSYFDATLAYRLDLAKQLVELLPKSPRAWIYRSFIQTENNDIEKARQSLKKAIALDDEFHYGYQQLGFSYLNQKPNDFGKAVQNMRQAVKLVPESTRAYINLGDAWRGNAKLKMARQNYSKAIEKDAENALAYLKRAHTNVFLDDIEQARMDYQKAVELASEVNQSGYSNYKAFTHIHEGDPMQAFDELKDVLEKTDKLNLTRGQKQGRNIFTLHNMIRICVQSKQYEKAEECLAKYAQIVKERMAAIQSERFALNQEANIELHRIYYLAHKGDFNQAHAKCTVVKEIYTKLENENLMENYYGTLAYVYFKENKFDDAIASYQKSDLNDIFNKY